MRIDMNTFSQINRQRSAKWHQGAEPWTLERWNSAFMGEFGEYCDELKKTWRVMDGIAGRQSERNLEELYENVMTELADAQCYFDLLIEKAEEVTGLDFGDFLAAKFNLVSRMYGFEERLSVEVCISSDRCVAKQGFHNEECPAYAT